MHAFMHEAVALRAPPTPCMHGRHSVVTFLSGAGPCTPMPPHTRAIAYSRPTHSMRCRTPSPRIIHMHPSMRPCNKMFPTTSRDIPRHPATSHDIPRHPTTFHGSSWYPLCILWYPIMHPIMHLMVLMVSHTVPWHLMASHGVPHCVRMAPPSWCPHGDPMASMQKHVFKTKTLYHHVVSSSCHFTLVYFHFFCWWLFHFCGYFYWQRSIL